MQITINVTGQDAVRSALKGIGRQAPYALQLTLNNTANDAQTAIRQGLTGFTLRRKTFVENTIYRNRSTDFATKTKPQAIVRVNPARDFLAQHEDGGHKTPQSGRHVAIPLPAVQPDRGTVVPRRLRPSGLRTNGQVRKVVTPSGVFLVRNRPGKGKGRLEGWRTEFLYKLNTSVPLRPRLAFHANARKAIDERFVSNALMAIERALATAR